MPVSQSLAPYFRPQVPSTCHATPPREQTARGLHVKCIQFREIVHESAINPAPLPAPGH